MNEFKQFLKEELLNDKVFRKEWDRTAPRYQVIKQILKLRHHNNLTQKELAKKIGTTQAVISRIENGNVNISIDFLIRIAKAFRKELEIKLSEKPDRTVRQRVLNENSIQ